MIDGITERILTIEPEHAKNIYGAFDAYLKKIEKGGTY